MDVVGMSERFAVPVGFVVVVVTAALVMGITDEAPITSRADAGVPDGVSFAVGGLVVRSTASDAAPTRSTEIRHDALPGSFPFVSTRFGSPARSPPGGSMTNCPLHVLFSEVGTGVMLGGSARVMANACASHGC